MITPTPGRVVLFWPRRDDNVGKYPGQPLAAIIVGIPPHQTAKVNLTVFGARGGTYAYENIPLVQPGKDKPKDGDWCQWSDYQERKAQVEEEDLDRIMAGVHVTAFRADGSKVQS